MAFESVTFVSNTKSGVMDFVLNHQFENVNLSIYEKRLDQIAVIVEREVHKILVHLSHEMPLVRSAKLIADLQDLAVKASVSSETSVGNGRGQGRLLLRLYTERLLFKATTSGARPPPEMLTYAQILLQALREPQTLH